MSPLTPFIAAMLSVAILTVPTFIYYALEVRRARRNDLTARVVARSHKHT
jgi:hypothetical protein